MGIVTTQEQSNREFRPARRDVDWKFWTPVVACILGGMSFLAGIFLSSTCTNSGPGENGCIEYAYDPLGRAITVVGLVLLLSGIYIIFAPHVGWPLIVRKR